MKWTIRKILSLTMNKTQLLWCSTHSSETKMWCLMKYLHNLHYNELSQICMFQMVQMERHFISKWTLVHVVICYHTICTGRLQDTRLIWTICMVPLITLWILLHTTTRKSNNWVHVLCVSLVAPNMRMVKFFIVDSKLNSIIGLDDSHQLQLVKFNCPHSSVLDRTEEY